MKPVSQALLNLLATRQFFAADLYTFSGGNLGNTVLRYCGGDQDIRNNGFLFTAGGQTGPYFDRTDNKAKCQWSVGVQVDNLLLDMIPGSAQVAGVQMQQAIKSGLFDGAEMKLEKAFMPAYGDVSRGTVVYFVGRVAEIDAGRSVCTFSINSHLELLNLQLPRNLYQSGCVNSLGDVACQATIPQTTGAVVLAGSTVGAINATLAGGPFPTGAFDLGVITFTSGSLNGLSFGVKQCVLTPSVTVNLQGYLPGLPANGDTFTIAYGCDKTLGIPVTTTGNTTGTDNTIQQIGSASGILDGMFVTGPNIPSNTTVTSVAGITVSLSQNTTGAATGATFTFQSNNGCSKFANQARFRGFPFVPQPSTAV